MGGVGAFYLYREQLYPLCALFPLGPPEQQAYILLQDKNHERTVWIQLFLLAKNFFFGFCFVLQD